MVGEERGEARREEREGDESGKTTHTLGVDRNEKEEGEGGKRGEKGEGKGGKMAFKTRRFASANRHSRRRRRPPSSILLPSLPLRMRISCKQCGAFSASATRSSPSPGLSPWGKHPLAPARRPSCLLIPGHCCRDGRIGADRWQQGGALVVADERRAPTRCAHRAWGVLLPPTALPGPAWGRWGGGRRGPRLQAAAGSQAAAQKLGGPSAPPCYSSGSIMSAPMAARQPGAGRQPPPGPPPPTAHER